MKTVQIAPFQPTLRGLNKFTLSEKVSFFSVVFFLNEKRGNGNYLIRTTKE